MLSFVDLLDCKVAIPSIIVIVTQLEQFDCFCVVVYGLVKIL